jgi:outer membrane lipoprotein carrier protein
MSSYPLEAASPLPHKGAKRAARRSRLRGVGLAILLGFVAIASARADAVQALRDFAREAKTGRAAFTQVVTSPDGVKKKTSSGNFEFARPNRFRFAYTKPYEQTIVGDGVKLWLYDADLQQVTVRAMNQALGITPVALLAGDTLERDFELKAHPSADGLDWVQAVPRLKPGADKDESIGFSSLRVGFKASALAAVELVDSFGQRSRLSFSELRTNVLPAADAFRFIPPKGVEVLTQ